MLYDIALTERFKGFLWDTSSAPGENRKMQLGTDHRGGGGEGGGSGLGVENFRAVGNFFGYQIPCMNFF